MPSCHVCHVYRGGVFDSHDLFSNRFLSGTGKKKKACPKVKKGAKTREIQEILRKVVPVLLHLLLTLAPGRCKSSDSL